MAQVADLLTRWQVKLADFDAKIAAYDALPPGTSDDDRFAALRAAEAEISTAAEPASSPAALRAALDAKRPASSLGATPSPPCRRWPPPPFCRC